MQRLVQLQGHRLLPNNDPGSATAICDACRLNCCMKRLPIFLIDGEQNLFSDFTDAELSFHGKHWEITMERCPHLQPDSRCGVYSQRPLDCRLHPLTFEASDDVLQLRIDITCLHSYLLTETQLYIRADAIISQYDELGLWTAYTQFIERNYPQGRIKVDVTHVDLEWFLRLRREKGPANACRRLVELGYLQDSIAAEVLTGVEQVCLDSSSAARNHLH